MSRQVAKPMGSWDQLKPLHPHLGFVGSSSVLHRILLSHLIVSLLPDLCPVLPSPSHLLPTAHHLEFHTVF